MIYSRTNIPQSKALPWRGVVLGDRADQSQPPMDSSSVPRRKIPHLCHWSTVSCVITPSWISCAIVCASLRVCRTCGTVRRGEIETGQIETFLIRASVSLKKIETDWTCLGPGGLASVSYLSSEAQRLGRASAESRAGEWEL